MEAGFLGLLFAAPGPERLAPFFVLYLAVFACYAIAVRAVLRARTAETPRLGRPALGAVLALALLFRATMLFGAPVLSSDIHRYLWDGRVMLSGGNPYLDPPSSPRLETLRDEGYTRIDHASVRTIYPPGAQILFAAGAALGPGVFGLKTLLVLADLLGIAVLRRILVRRGMPPLRILIYAWNPLVVVEAAWSGHLEPAGILCMLFGAAAIIQKHPMRSTVALTLAGLVKILPFALFLPLARTIRLRLALVVPLLVAAAYWPFRAAGDRLLDGLGEYARHWLANESLFGILRAAITWIDPTPALKTTVAFLRSHLRGSEPLDLLYAYVYPLDLAKGVSVLIVLGFAVGLAWRRVEPLRGCYLLTGLILLLSPTLHPWYLLWILPWLCLFPSRSWILLSGLVTLAYAEAAFPDGGNAPLPWTRLLEYVPFYALLLSDWLRGRLRGTVEEARVDPSPTG
jgi:hypothetical protein